MERDYTTGAGTAIVFNFNSHAHVERDNSFRWDYIPMIISTHTLTWSVTISGLKRGDNNADFNSHAHVERD